MIDVNHKIVFSLDKLRDLPGFNEMSCRRVRYVKSLSFDHAHVLAEDYRYRMIMEFKNNGNLLAADAWASASFTVEPYTVKYPDDKG